MNSKLTLLLDKKTIEKAKTFAKTNNASLSSLLIKVTAVDEKIMLLAANSDFKDFEDSIQYYAAKSKGIEFLITRNKVDYKITDLTVCTLKEYLSIYHKPATN